MTATLAARFHFLLRPSRPALAFALRTTAAALAALFVAMALGLDNPHWAAMTVWIVAQPTRGMVVSKGLYRLAGSAAGSLAAAAIVALAGPAPLPLSLGLAAWVALCAAASTLLRGFRAYGAVLAGYSAALVAVVGLGQHHAIAQVALMRVAEVAVGIVVSGLATALFVPGSTARDLLVRARSLSRDTLRWSALVLRHGAAKEIVAQQHRLLAEIAQINAQADMAAAGSRGLGLRMAHARGLIAALLTLMALVRARAANPETDEAELAEALDRAAATLSRTSPDLLERWPDLRAALAEAAGCYAALAGDTEPPEAEPLIAIDWRAALGAGLRAFAGVGLIGALWAATGWRDGSTMLMATAIMCSVFAATDTPSRNVLMAMKGATLAVASALLVAMLAPHGTGFTVAALLPFMVLGGLAIANRATIIPGTDYSMVLLLLGQPGVTPLAGPAPLHLAHMGLGIVCGMGAAALVNRIGVPNTARQRMDSLAAEIVRDLAALAAAPPGKGHKWRGRACHRILRLALKAHEVGADGAARLEDGLNSLIAGLAISRLRLLLGSDLDRSHKDGILLVLAACRRLERDPAEAVELARREAERQHGEARRALLWLGNALRT